jgi:hypothetical protein
MSTGSNPEMFRLLKGLDDEVDEDDLAPELREVASPKQKGRPQRSPLELALEDNGFRDGLFQWTLQRTGGHHHDAQDVLSIAFERAIRRERHGEPWDPAGKITAGLHMIRILQGALANRAQNKDRQRVGPVQDIDVYPSRDVPLADTVVERFEASERRRLASELHRKLVASGKDPVAVDILESAFAGVVELPEVVARTGRSRNEVRAGMKRLAGYAQATINTFRQQARFQ